MPETGARKGCCLRGSLLWHTYYSRISHGRMIKQQSLKLRRRNLGSLDLDELLYDGQKLSCLASNEVGNGDLAPIHDEETPVLIYICNISGFEVSIRGKSLPGRLLVPPVSLHDIWSAEPDFAALTSRDFGRTIFVHEPSFDIWDELADGVRIRDAVGIRGCTYAGHSVWKDQLAPNERPRFLALNVPTP